MCPFFTESVPGETKTYKPYQKKRHGTGETEKKVMVYSAIVKKKRTHQTTTTTKKKEDQS